MEEAVSPPDNTQLKLLFDISKEISMALDLRMVLQRILFLSVKNVQANSGSIIILDDRGEPVDSAIIHSGKVFSDETTQRLKATLEGGLAGWVVNNRDAALVKDTSKDERWIQRAYKEGQDTGPKSSVSAPLIVRDRLVGVMTLSHPSPGYFNENHLVLVQSIADLASVAALNARLYDESQRKADVMEALADSAASINETLQFHDMLQRILEQTTRALQVEAVSLALIQQESGELEFLAATGSQQDQIVGLKIKLGQGIAGWVAQSGESVIVPDTRSDPRFYKQIDANTGYETRTIAAAPIRSQGLVIGVLEAINPIKPFDKDAITVLNGIGNLAGTAIDHARLFEEIQVARGRYLELFEDNVDPIYITNWEGKILEANRQAIQFTLIEADALLQMNIHHFHQVDWDVVGKNFENLKSAETLSYRSILHPNNTEEIPVEVHVRRVVIEGAERVQWIFRDITESENLDRLREDLASMI